MEKGIFWSHVSQSGTFSCDTTRSKIPLKVSVRCFKLLLNCLAAKMKIILAPDKLCYVVN